ncbi:RloB domain-containing protein [Nostoc sp. UHCC 0702]|nr:RloB domain-containing protein [Nostoc sp. UHCC 0702]
MPKGNSHNSLKRGKSTQDLQRRSGNKNSRNYILIVVEGEETEYNYVCALKHELELSTVDIKVVPAYGGDPLVTVNEAEKLCQENERNSNRGNTVRFDKVFCIFDDDNKPKKYQEALPKAQKNGFETITSIPCFEFWFLLHYCYTTSPFANYKELCPKLETEMIKAGVLKKGELYNKSDKELYKKLKSQQDNAIKHAVRLEKNHPNEDGCTNPSTKVHIFVQELQKQKQFK